jgi:phosphatidylinositol-3-phosphatase
VSPRFRTGRRWAVVPAVVALGLGLLGLVVSPTSGAAPAKKAFALPPIKHIWVIVLENQDYAGTFGDPAADPYLATTLPSEGALLEDYYATGHESNDNYISLVSGQPPNPSNQSDCQTYSPFGTGTDTKGIESGLGCVYPTTIKSIGKQVTAKGLDWKAYEQDMGNDPTREAAACGHPALDAVDNTQDAEAGDGYATRHDPFVYFESVTKSTAYCGRHVVALGSTTGAMPAAAVPGETGLATDLGSAATTPAYSFITPNLCDDGHDFPCKNQTGGSSALADIDQFLSTWIPKITGSPAYAQGGLIDITFDESDGAQSDSTACCQETPGPASPLPGITGPGGGRIGSVLLSPYIAPGTRSTVAYNHYSTLATDEKLLGLHALGEAKTVSSTFGADVFTRPAG